MILVHAAVVLNTKIAAEKNKNQGHTLSNVQIMYAIMCVPHFL